MSLPLIIRGMLPTERSMILADWKRDLAAKPARWKMSLSTEEFWAVLDNVIEKLTLPSARIKIACHEAEISTPMAWIAVRDGEILHMHCRRGLSADPELAAAIQRMLEVDAQATVVAFSPVLELRRIA